jgi:hypothetical protein
VSDGVIRALLYKVWAQVKMIGFSWRGQYNEMGFSLLDPPLLVAFLIGVGRAVYKWRQLEYALPLLGIPVLLLPDLVSDRLDPHELRVLGVFTLVYVLVGLGATVLVRWVAERHLSSGRFALVLVCGLALMVGSGIRLHRYGTQWTVQAQQSDSYLYNLTDIAEASYIQDAGEPILIPLAEYERAVLRYLTGDTLSVHRSALDEHGSIRPGLQAGDVLLLMPDSPDRKRLEGPTYITDPRRYALLKQGTVYLLPPLDAEAESTIASLVGKPPVERVRNINGSGVAAVYRLDASALSLDVGMEHPLGTAFDDRIELVGYTSTGWHLEPGNEVGVTLYWQARRDIRQDYRMFAHLIDLDGGVLAFADTTPGQGTYPTHYWRVDEWVPTYHRFVVPTDLSPGRYEIEVGWFNRLDGERLPVLDGRQQRVASRALVGPLKVALPSVDVPERQPPVQLGEAISLVGYEWAGQPVGSWTAQPGDVVVLRMAWSVSARPTRDYTLFVHLASVDEHIVAQHDAPVLGGTYPTSIWEPGEVLVEEVVFPVPRDVAAGTYRLWTGLYYPLDGVRLEAVDDAGGRLPADRIPLGQVLIEEMGQ